MPSRTNSLKLAVSASQRPIADNAIATTTFLADAGRAALLQMDVQKSVLYRSAAVCECAPDGTITVANVLFADLSGYTRDELVGMSLADMLSQGSDAEAVRAMRQALLNDDIWQGELCFQRKNGTELWLRQTAAAMRDDDGTVVSYFYAGTDITETKSLQSQNARHGQLAQLGQLTATVAHEIRNPLGAVKTAAYVLGRRVQVFNASLEKADTGLEPLDVSNQLERIGSGISRCDRIISELLDFTRNRPVNAKRGDLDKWLAQIVDEEAKTVPPAVQFTMTGGLESKAVPFDADQLRRVIVNLVSNASEAMVGKAGDTNAILTENPHIAVSTRISDGYVEIAVQDNGPGISPENLAKIREPLFTTKSFGVGLGIPAIEKILKNHGGQLEIESTLGSGTTMTAKIPLGSDTIGD